MKGLFLTDTHIRVNNPVSRLDYFPETILKKLEYIARIIKEHGIGFVIHGGDWLNRPDVPYSLLNKIIDVIILWNVPVYTVVGNHDIYGYNPETFKRTGLSVLERIGFIKRLSQNPITVGNFSLTGVDSYYGMDKKEHISDYSSLTVSSSLWNVHTVHGFLTEYTWEHVAHTLIDDVDLQIKCFYGVAQPDVILTGHEHQGYGIKKTSHATYCNPGALARVTAGIGDVSREVKVAILDDSDRSLELFKFPEDIARPASEILDRNRLEQEKITNKTLSNFKDTIEKFNITRSGHMDIFQMLRSTFGDEIPGEILDIIKLKIEAAEERRKDNR